LSFASGCAPETVSLGKQARRPSASRTAALLAGLVEDAIAGTTATRDRLELLRAPKRLSRVVDLNVLASAR
jgi:hypothetical protein